MEDAEILTLLSDRKESALARTTERYGPLMRKIAFDLLSSEEDAEEIVNDALKRLWDSVPPVQPKSLGAYVCRIVRNLAVDRLREQTALKRGGKEKPTSLTELEACLPDSFDPQRLIETEALAACIDAFLRAANKEDRILFLQRYYYGLSVFELAKNRRQSAGTVKTRLRRLRLSLKDHLTKEGFDL